MRAAARVSSTEFKKWLANSAVGDMLIYHEGDLAVDRDCSDFSAMTRDEKRRATSIDETGRVVLDAAARGHLMLFQKRLGRGFFRYIALRVAPTRDDRQPLPPRAVK